MARIGTQFIDKVRHQVDFVSAISYQLEAATHAYYEAKNYKEYLEGRIQTEQSHLNQLKEQQ